MFPTNLNSILLLDGIDAVCKDTFLLQKGISVEVKGSQSHEELLKIIENYDAVVVRSATKVNSEIIEKGAKGKLKLVGRAGTGTDNIDLAAATKFGIIVMNTPGGNTISAAEHTCSLICSLGRFIPQACASLKEGKWERKKFMGAELFGKVLAIVGLGRIGIEVAQRMQSFGMKTIGYDPFVSDETAISYGIQRMELEGLWPEADYITVHTPLLPHTKNMINEKVFEACKEGVKIINVARGGIVDENALLEALNSGKCGGAGLDVFVDEPPKNLDLCSHPKVVCTPHLGASTKEAQVRVAQEIAQQILDGIGGKQIQGIVNGRGFAAYGDPLGEQWMTLGTSMGKVCSAFLDCRSRDNVNINVRSVGKDYEKFASHVDIAALVGYLDKISGGKSNLITASTLAREYKVNQVKDIVKETDEPISRDNYLRMRISAQGESVDLYGSVIDGSQVVFAINGNSIESPIILRKGVTLLVFDGADDDLSGILKSVLDTKIDILSFTSVIRQKPDKKYFIISSNTNKELNLKQFVGACTV